MKIPISISNRHIHLSQKHADILFWTNYKFKILKELSQPWQFAYQETITAKWPKGEISKIRILWPVRKKTQLEILYSDNYKLGVSAPIKISWDLKDSIGWITLIWPNGKVELQKWVIVAQRHLHITETMAKQYWLTNWQIIKLQVNAPRPIIFENIVVRANKNYALDCHIDRDEWNALWQSKDIEGTIVW